MPEPYIMIAPVLALLGFAIADPLLWGPYRANLYFGMRPRLPQSLLTGLMWFNTGNFAGIQKLRHDCLQDDGTTYSWTSYETRVGGTQHIWDREQALNLTIDLAKSEDGKSWQVRVRGDQPADGINTLIWYNALESQGQFGLDKDQSSLTRHGLANPYFSGQSPELGEFSLKFQEPAGNKYPESDHIVAEDFDAELWQYTSLNIPSDNIWRAKDIYLTLLQDNVNQLGVKYDPETTPLASFPAWAALSLNNDDTLAGNMHIVQKTFQGPFEFNVEFNDPQVDFDARDKQLDAKFARFGTSKYTEFAKALVSNLAAGVGYFYGDQHIAQADTPTVVETTEPRELYTCTPSRGFFPRGFYWDEGFQLLGLLDTDIEQVLDILESWFNLMDESGWIAREQILGPEGRARVPKEFQLQVADIANPPTLITFLAHLGSVDDPKVKIQLKRVFPLLETHFQWLRRSQRGKLVDYDRDAHSLNEGYRWRGRTATHILASGIDDYPRSPFISDGELNVDLLAWVGAMADSLARIAETIGEPTKVKQYSKIHADVKQNLVDLHWSESDATFCDVAVDEYEEDVHECHVGYVSHLPFFLRLVKPEDDARLLAMLKSLRDPEQLWSVGGIRSLSKSDAVFGTGENYWRGSVWFNMNYLALDALRYYHSRASPAVASQCATIYQELRNNLIENTYQQWLKTGKAWEQYTAITGEGRGVQQFTGWTALAANILTWPETLGDAAKPVEASESAEPESAEPETAEPETAEPEKEEL